MKPIISAQNLLKRYGRHTVVDHVDFEIPRGKCFGFLGPNGAGKTTTLRLILGLTPLDDGQLTVFDLPVTQYGRDIRRRIGVVPQADNLDPDFTVANNLAVYASYFRLPRQLVNERITRLLAFAALTERRNDKTDHLSGGMKRRLTIARSLINDPELVILDEPTTGLDPQARHVIWSRLAELKSRGVTLLLTTHYMEEAERLCDELVIMDNGKILDQGSPASLIQRHVENEVVEIRASSEAELSAWLDLPDARVEQHGNSLYCYSSDCASLLEKLRAEPGLTFLHRPASLEDVFLKLTGRELRD